MGDLFTKTGQIKAAADEYEKALTTNFIDADRMLDIADRFVNIGYKARANSVWNRLKTMNLTSAQVKKLSSRLGTDLTVSSKK